jgi:hypothetical protein
MAAMRVQELFLTSEQNRGLPLDVDPASSVLSYDAIPECKSRSAATIAQTSFFGVHGMVGYGLGGLPPPSWPAIGTRR